MLSSFKTVLQLSSPLTQYSPSSTLLSAGATASAYPVIMRSTQRRTDQPLHPVIQAM